MLHAIAGALRRDDAERDRLDLLFESTDLAADPGWKLLIYTAEPGSRTADALRLLASWTTTQEQDTAPNETTARLS